MTKNLNDLKRFIEKREVRVVDEIFTAATRGLDYEFRHESHAFFCKVRINEHNHLVFVEMLGRSHKDIDCMYYHADEISELKDLYHWLLSCYGHNVHVKIEKTQEKTKIRFFNEEEKVNDSLFRP